MTTSPSFDNLIPVCYTAFRPPVPGDTVVAPFGSMLDVWPAGRTKLLKEKRSQCSCPVCSGEGSVGTVSLRLSPSVQKYHLQASASDGEATSLSAAARSAASSEGTSGASAAAKPPQKLTEDIKRCVSQSEIARPLLKASPLHAALATGAPEATIRAILRARPGDVRKESSGMHPLHVALEAPGASVATKLAILRAYPAAARVDYAEADPGHPLGGTALHCAVYLGDDPLVIAALVRAYPHAAKALDSTGALPVQVAVKLGAPDAVVQALLAAAPEAAKLPYPWPVSLPIHDAHCNRRYDETPRGAAETLSSSSASSSASKTTTGKTTSNGKAEKHQPSTTTIVRSVKTVALSTPSLLVATLLLRKSVGWYGNLRAAGKKGKRVAAVLQSRSATHAVLKAHPAAADALVEYHKMTPAHVAATVGAPVCVFKALARAAAGEFGRDGQKNLPVHIAILRSAPPGVITALLRSSSSSS